MIRSSSWTGRYGGRPSLAVDLYHLTPKWLWGFWINRDATWFRLWPRIVVTAEAIQDAP